MILDYVKFIKTNKDKNWDKWLTEADWEIIDSQVLPSNWYPYDCWQRMGAAAFNEVAMRDLKLIRSFGPMVMKNLLAVYKNVLVEGDPIASIKKFSQMRRNLIRGAESDMIIQDQGDNHVTLKLLVTDHDREVGDPECFIYAVAGNLDELIKQAGGKNASGDVKEVEGGYEVTFVWK